MPLLLAGDTVVQYFQSHNPGVETLASQSSLAEWIVDLTTEVGGRCAPSPLPPGLESAEAAALSVLERSLLL